MEVRDDDWYGVRMVNTPGNGSEAGRAARIESLASAIEAALRDHRTLRDSVIELAAVHGASPGELRAARMLASAALLLAFASKGECSIANEEQVDRDLMAIRSLCETGDEDNDDG